MQPEDFYHDQLLGSTYKKVLSTRVKWPPPHFVGDFQNGEHISLFASFSAIATWDSYRPHPEQSAVFFIYHTGGTVQSMWVDEPNGVVLMAMMDRRVRGFDLKNTQPLVKYGGHMDVVRGIGFLPDKQLYVTGEWWKKGLSDNFTSSFDLNESVGII